MSTQPTVNWPTKGGWYLIENRDWIDANTAIHRVEYLHEKADDGSWAGQWLTAGLYVHEGRGYEHIQSHFTIDGKPWKGLRFIPLDLPALVRAHDERGLEQLLTGDRVILPTSKEHAEAMLAVATHYLSSTSDPTIP